MIPIPQHGAGFVPYKLVQLCDKAVLLKQGDELARGHDSQFRMIPPYQCLRSCQGSVPDPVLGLQINLKLPFCQGSLHAVRDRLLQQKPAAQLLIIISKISSILPLDALGGQQRPITHLLYGKTMVHTGIDPPFHHNVPAAAQLIDPVRNLPEPLLTVLGLVFQQADKLV